VDEIVVRTALEAGGFPAVAATQPADPERQLIAKRLFLRVRHGGMGLFSCAANARAAFLGSAALTNETVRDIGIDPKKPEAAQLPYVKEHKDAIEWFKQRLPGCSEIKNWNIDYIFGAPESKLQHYLSEELAKADREDVLALFPDTEDGRQRRAEFEECGVPKAGAWVNANTADKLCQLNNGEFWIACAMRLGLTRKLYPEVSPNAICKACKQAVGTDVPIHGFRCSKSGRRGRNLLHTASKNGLATVERLAAPGTNILMEPFVVPSTGAQPTEQKYARSRADISVRANGVHYIVDVTIVDATLGAKPVNTTYEAGKATEQAYNDKVTQYTVTRFSGLSEQQLRVAAFDPRGGPSKSTLAYLKEIKRRECSHKPTIPKSVIAARLYQRVSVAVQRAVAYNVMEYRLWRVPVAVPIPRVAGPSAVSAAGPRRRRVSTQRQGSSSGTAAGGPPVYAQAFETGGVGVAERDSTPQTRGAAADGTAAYAEAFETASTGGEAMGGSPPQTRGDEQPCVRVAPASPASLRVATIGTTTVTGSGRGSSGVSGRSGQQVTSAGALGKQRALGRD
jgi:hypothetical protein